MAKFFKKIYKYTPLGWLTKGYKKLGFKEPDEYMENFLDSRSDAAIILQMALPFLAGAVGGLDTKPSTSEYNGGDYDPEYDEYLGDTGLAFGSDKKSSTSLLSNLINSFGGSGNALGTLLGTTAGIGTTIYQNAYNKEAADTAYARQDEFYTKHLSMPAKVKEYQDAGLNPMSLAGAGAGATSAPNVQPAAPAADLGNILSNVVNTYNSTRQTSAEVARAKQETLALSIENKWKDALKSIEYQQALANANKTETEIQINKESLRKVIADAKFAEIVAQYQPQVLEAELGNKNADTALKKAQTNYTETQEKEAKQRINQAYQRFPKEMTLLDENIKKVQQEIKNLVATENLTNAQFNESVERTNNLVQSSRKLAAEVNLLEEDFKYYIWNHSRDIRGAGFSVPFLPPDPDKPRKSDGVSPMDVQRWGLSNGFLKFDDEGNIVVSEEYR